MSVVVTVALFSAAQLLVVRSARQTARAAMINDVFTALEHAARVQARPVVVRLWSRPELEYALLVPRLLVGLPRKERIVAVWAQTQVNTMLAAKTQGEVITIAADLSGKIAEWHLGQRHRAWFAQEVRDHHPMKNRAARRSFHTSAQAVGVIALATVCAALPTAIGSVVTARWLSSKD
jgi:hypothetical protein